MEEPKELKLEKLRFHKKVWYSITKIEKYPEMAAHGLWKALGYLSTLVLVITLVFCIGSICNLEESFKQAVENTRKRLFRKFNR